MLCRCVSFLCVSYRGVSLRCLRCCGKLLQPLHTVMAPPLLLLRARKLLRRNLIGRHRPTSNCSPNDVPHRVPAKMQPQSCLLWLLLLHVSLPPPADLVYDLVLATHLWRLDTIGVGKLRTADRLCREG